MLPIRSRSYGFSPIEQDVTLTYALDMLRRIVLGLLIITTSAAFAKGGKGKHADHVSPPVVVMQFAPADIRILREHYTVHPVSLPPGLEKKYQRTGTLPPGWQKKMAVFPAVVESRLPPLCSYCGRGVIDGYGVIYDKRTRIILDVVQLTADILR